MYPAYCEGDGVAEYCKEGNCPAWAKEGGKEAPDGAPEAEADSGETGGDGAT